MKTILIFIDWYLPAYKAGGPIRAIINVVDLLKNDYKIFIYTSSFDQGSSSPIVASNKINRWLNLEPNVQIFYSNNTKIKDLVAIGETIKPDYIYINSMWSFDFAIKPLIAFKNNNYCKIILAPRGMLHDGAMKFKKSKKTFFLKLANLFCIYSKILFHATDEKEYNDLIKKVFIGKRKLNQADVCLISDVPPMMVENSIIKKEVSKLNLVFISRISPKKNLDFAITLLGKVKSNLTVNFNIYGPIEDKSYFKKCQLLINQNTNKNVTYRFLGELNFNEVSEVLQQNHFFILPTYGENFGYAIFESFVNFRPVIISNKTPWLHLEKQKAGFDISIDDEKKYIDAIEFVAKMGGEEYNYWCEGAGSYAKRYISSLDFKAKYVKMFNN